MTIFEKIVARQIPASIVYEDDDLLAFRDLHPQAPVHVLIIPKRPLTRIGAAEDTDADLLGRMLLASRLVAKQEGVFDSGYRLVINHGPDAGESVPHLHLHLLGGRAMDWPPG
jgi:histidine triad (HIT) family protein